MFQLELMEQVLLVEGGQVGVGDDGVHDDFDFELFRGLEFCWVLADVSPIGLNQVVDNFKSI
jgi:hypothetical protein